MYVRFLYSMVAAALFSVVSITAHAALMTNLEGYWKFENNGTDSSGNNRDLTLNGGPGFGTGLFGQALSLTGNSSQTASRGANDDAVFDFGSNDFTIQSWVNFNTLAGEQVIMEKFTGGAGPGWTLTKLSGGSQLQFFMSGIAGLNTPVLGFGTGTFHQFAVSRIGNSIDIYFDGTNVISLGSIAAIGDTSNPLLFGERQGGQNFPLNGFIDESAIWSRGLSGAEISQIYNGGQGQMLISMTTMPEPGTLAILGLGLVALGLARRKRAA